MAHKSSKMPNRDSCKCGLLTFKNQLFAKALILICAMLPTPSTAGVLCDRLKSGDLPFKLGKATEFTGRLWLSSRGDIDCEELDLNSGTRFKCGGNIVFGDQMTTRDGIELKVAMQNFKKWTECVDPDSSNPVAREWMSWEGAIIGTNEIMKFIRSIDYPIKIIRPSF